MASSVGPGEAIPATFSNDNDPSTESPLYEAVRKGDIGEITTLLADLSIDPNAVNDNNLPEPFHWTSTPLHKAAFDGNTEAVKMLLAHPKIQPSPVDSYGRTPLHEAAAHGYLEMVEALFAHPDIKPNLADKNGKIPLHGAAENHHVTIAAKLLTANPNIDCASILNTGHGQSGVTLLHAAAMRGLTDALATFLKVDGVDPNLENHFNRTALCLAIEKKRANIVEILLEHPAVNPSASICAAASRGNGIHIIETLLADPRTDPSLIGKEGKTPLYYIIQEAFVNSEAPLRAAWLGVADQLTSTLFDRGGSIAISNAFKTALEAAKETPNFSKEGLAFLTANSTKTTKD